MTTTDTPDPKARNLHPFKRPSRRPLRVFALDPMRIDRGAAGMVTPRATLYIPFEDDLKPGPRGKRIQVIDYDGVHRCFYEPIDLDHLDVLIRDGLAPMESDPRFHQQMVYAVVANLWADVETALGRRVTFGRKDRLTILPHAFYGANAYYDPETSALLFGYFRADEEKPGANLPGQMVYTCLSHDVITHEATHALIDRLRPLFMIDSNPDVAAFHEGFADLIAIFQHFKLPEVLMPALADTRGRLDQSEALLGLARQFGYATGTGAALRTADPTQADPSKYRASLEPHQRGAVLVRAVFDAFLGLYERRTADLIRLASGGSGVLRAGALHPDLVNRLAREVTVLANQMFTALIRAFDYLPPLDVTFEDLLRALVTVDMNLSPSDDSLRVALIEGFRQNGIYPVSAGSLDDQAVALMQADPNLRPVPIEPEVLLDVIRELDETDPEGHESVTSARDSWGNWAKDLHAWANEDDQRRHLGFVEGAVISVEGMHPTIRYRANGRPTVDYVVRFIQKRPGPKPDSFDGLVPTAGCTVVADTHGAVRYLITKPLPPDAGQPALPPGLVQDADDRMARLTRRLQEVRQTDPGDAYRDRTSHRPLQLRFALLHSAHDREDES